MFAQTHKSQDVFILWKYGTSLKVLKVGMLKNDLAYFLDNGSLAFYWANIGYFFRFQCNNNNNDKNTVDNHTNLNSVYYEFGDQNFMHA